jgi:hypothetical protein
MSARARLFLVLFAAGAGVGLGWFALRTHRDCAEAENQLVAARERQAKLSVELARAQQASLSPVAASSATTAPAAVPPATPPAPKTVVRKNAPSVMDLAQDNPQLLNYFIASKKAELQQRYGVLFQQLQLTPEQRNKFKEIQAAATTRSIDLGAAVHEQGLTYDDPAVKKLQTDSERQTETELIALLGDAGFQNYQEFNRTLSLRGFIDGFAVQVASTEPLTPMQADQLTRALIAAGVRRKEGNIDAGSLNWAEVDRAAQVFLSPAQFAAWKLGVAHNPAGGSRADQELRKLYDAVVAKSATPKP